MRENVLSYAFGMSHDFLLRDRNKHITEPGAGQKPAG